MGKACVLPDIRAQVRKPGRSEGRRLKQQRKVPGNDHCGVYLRGIGVNRGGVAWAAGLTRSPPLPSQARARGGPRTEFAQSNMYQPRSSFGSATVEGRNSMGVLTSPDGVRGR